ncbi:acyltransferase family protein [Rhizobium mongolense]|uniref:Peptidoglycan/LPS O-acetylase OafA/YrhL n=1 Tax=Rhizobium mongolense TaxID=57676 RepID=A0A7W6WIC7_9HYPH|nr:acyltransferase [Rhizobium mongolense]MBB4278885.1 peptidoglycan/LPS O-acetylase OafA/YrhL [Rhizobium mongolense]
MFHARDRQLDGLRTFAISMVLYDHFLAAEGSVLGHLGVRLFFVLSGFLITRLLLEARSAVQYEPGNALKSFYLRRALRIFPPYFAVLGFVWLVDLEGARGSLKWHALYLSNFWYALRDEWTPWVLCHTWSLSIEEQFYIAWPLIILFAPRRLIGPICIAVITFSLGYRFYWPLTGTPSLARDLLPPASMDALVAGALLAVHRSRTDVWPQWIRLSWVPLTVVAVIFLWLKSAAMPPALEWLAWIGRELSPLVPFVLLVGCCSSGLRGAFGRLLELSPIVAVGRISYGVYLFHPIVLSLIVKAQPWIPVNVSEQGPSRFVIGTTATLMVASISWLAFERPLNQLKRYFPYVRSKSFAHLPSSIKQSEAGGREYDASAYRRSYANRGISDEHAS